MDERRSPEGQAGWRGDHLLTRPERLRLREEVSALNVYNLGWMRNIRTVLLGSDRRRGVPVYLRALWPLATTDDR
jgi:palmitoyltransferase